MKYTIRSTEIIQWHETLNFQVTNTEADSHDILNLLAYVLVSDINTDANVLVVVGATKTI